MASGDDLWPRRVFQHSSHPKNVKFNLILFLFADKNGDLNQDNDTNEDLNQDDDKNGNINQDDQDEL